jgi:hypothetical protein
MNEDPIVAEIRANRKKIAQKYNFNIKEIVDAARFRQKSSKHTLVPLAANKNKPRIKPSSFRSPSCTT